MLFELDSWFPRKRIEELINAPDRLYFPASPFFSLHLNLTSLPNLSLVLSLSLTLTHPTSLSTALIHFTAIPCYLCVLSSTQLLPLQEGCSLWNRSDPDVAVSCCGVISSSIVYISHQTFCISLQTLVRVC